MEKPASKKVLIIIVLLLAVMPFFWFKPGEMDLGGDSGRLHFYDPANQIQNLGLYYISPFGIGLSEANFAYLPFVGLLVIIKQIIGSSYVIISFHNTIKIVVGFLAIYTIVKELAGKNKNIYFVELASILAGFFYLFNPAMIGNYVKAITTHDQVFLNPLMFYLFLRFFLTGSMKYMWIFLVISFIFANNFSYQAAPPLFAFYPFALLFIILYCIFIRHVRIQWKRLLIVALFFLGLHAFQLVPQVFDLFTSGSNTNTRTFNTGDIERQIGYFYGILDIPKLSFHLLSYSIIKGLASISIVIPFVVLFGLLLNRKREKTILLAAVFFLLTFFFVTGKVTYIGIEFYKTLFYIPGFTMFRNFYGQWQFVFYFFYSLLFGLTILSILQKVNLKIFSRAFFLFLVSYFVISSWQFINGNLVNPFREGAKDIKAAIIMDPKYEGTMSFIRSLPDDGKVLILPFTDSYIQVIHGLNKEGAYVGISTIGQLTGKKDFAGYVQMAPFSEVFWQLSKEKDYESIKRLLGLLNIRYIFYNSDTRIYDTTFPAGPYSPNYVRKYMPPNQNGYKGFIKNLSSEKVFENGFYSLYKTEQKVFLPHFYTAGEILSYNDDPQLNDYGKASAFFPNKKTNEIRVAYIENEICKEIFPREKCDKDKILKLPSGPKILFEKINPTKYKIRVSNAKNPYILVFSEAFHKNWKVFISDKPQEKTVIRSYFDGEVKEGEHKNIFLDKNIFETFPLKPISEDMHFIVNGYANGWYIKSQDLKGSQEYELIVEMTGQRVFYISLILSGIVFIGLVLWGIKLFVIIRTKNK